MKKTCPSASKSSRPEGRSSKSSKLPETSSIYRCMQTADVHHYFSGRWRQLHSRVQRRKGGRVPASHSFEHECGRVYHQQGRKAICLLRVATVAGDIARWMLYVTWSEEGLQGDLVFDTQEDVKGWAYQGPSCLLQVIGGNSGLQVRSKDQQECEQWHQHWGETAAQWHSHPGGAKEGEQNGPYLFLLPCVAERKEDCAWDRHFCAQKLSWLWVWVPSHQRNRLHSPQKIHRLRAKLRNKRREGLHKMDRCWPRLQDCRDQLLRQARRCFEPEVQHVRSHVLAQGSEKDLRRSYLGRTGLHEENKWWGAE